MMVGVNHNENSCPHEINAIKLTVNIQNNCKKTSESFKIIIKFSNFPLTVIFKRLKFSTGQPVKKNNRLTGYFVTVSQA